MTRIAIESRGTGRWTKTHAQYVFVFVLSLSVVLGFSQHSYAAAKSRCQKARDLNAVAHRSGAITLVWAEARGKGCVVRFTSRSAAGQWSKAKDLARYDKGGSYSSDLDTAVDRRGNVTAVWAVRNPKAGNFVRAAFKPASRSSWRKPVRISGFDKYYSQSPRLALNRDGTSAVIWTQDDQRLLSSFRRRIGGEWSKAKELPVQGIGSYDLQVKQTQLATTSEGRFVAVWVVDATGSGSALMNFKSSLQSVSADQNLAWGRTAKVARSEWIEQVKVVPDSSSGIELVWLSKVNLRNRDGTFQPTSKIFHVAVNSKGKWSEPNVFHSSSGFALNGPKAAGNGSIGMGVLWSDIAEDDRSTNLYLLRRTADGALQRVQTVDSLEYSAYSGYSFSGFELLSSSSKEMPIFWITKAVAADGHSPAGCSENFIETALLDFDGYLSQPKQLSAERGFFVTQPEFAASNDGSMLVASWVESPLPCVRKSSSVPYAISVALRSRDGDWSESVKIR